MNRTIADAPLPLKIFAFVMICYVLWMVVQVLRLTWKARVKGDPSEIRDILSEDFEDEAHQAAYEAKQSLEHTQKPRNS